MVEIGLYQNFTSLRRITNSPLWKKKEILSPRMWGCTVNPRYLIALLKIVPTHVGVYRIMI